MTEILGQGKYGRVFKTWHKNDETAVVAVKAIDKHKLLFGMSQIMGEITILQKMSHPNIVKFYESYDDSKHVNVIMEYV